MKLNLKEILNEKIQPFHHIYIYIHTHMQDVQVA